MTPANVLKKSPNRQFMNHRPRCIQNSLLDCHFIVDCLLFGPGRRDSPKRIKTHLNEAEKSLINDFAAMTACLNHVLRYQHLTDSTYFLQYAFARVFAVDEISRQRLESSPKHAVPFRPYLMQMNRMCIATYCKYTALISCAVLSISVRF